MKDFSHLPPHLRPPDLSKEEDRKKLEDFRKYNEGVGKLITGFSGAEIILFSILGSLWNVPLPVARAIYSDLRIDAAINTAKRLLEARKQVFGANEFEKDIEKWLTYIFDQLGIINGIRNHIVHHGVVATTDFSKPVVSNRLRARAASQVKEIEISPADLEALNSDLGGIIAMLPAVSIAILSGPSPKAAEAFAMLEETKKRNAWRYKSPLQGGKKGKSPDKAPEPPPQPQSSGE